MRILGADKSGSYADLVWNDGSTKGQLEIYQSGTYWLSYTDGCNRFYDTFKVQMHFLSKPVITIDEQRLGVHERYESYQWLRNGSIINGATDSVYTVTENGKYKVVVENNFGCVDTSDEYEVTNLTGIKSSREIETGISTSPNPTVNLVTAHSRQPVKLELLNLEGRLLSSDSHSNTISLSDLPAGVYILKIYDHHNKLLAIEKVIKSNKN